MASEPRHFDAAEGDLRRDEAIARVDEHGDETWKAAALAAIEQAVVTRHRFTTDLIWWKLDRAGVAPPREARLMGAVMKQAQGRGWIVPTSDSHRSVRPECHRRWLMVWATRPEHHEATP
jgi:hypothetical protein